MSDDQVVRLLEEIRDLQREQLANQKLALESQQLSIQNQQASLQNQQQSMARQKSALERSKITYIVLIVIVLLLGASFVVPVLTEALNWILRR